MASEPFSRNPPAISEVQAEQLRAWLESAAPLVGVHGWRWSVSTHAAERDSYATSFIRDQGDDVVVAVAREFFERPERERRHTLTHELLHPHFHRVTRLAEKLLENELGQRTEAVIVAAVREAEEQAIDRLAYAISAYLPPVPDG